MKPVPLKPPGTRCSPCPECDGKLRAADVEAYLETFYADASYTHMVFPGMVFIAHPSELGTLYSLAELEELGPLPPLRHPAVLGRCAPRLWPGRSRHRRLPGRHRAPHRRLLHRRHQMRALCGEAVVFPRGGMPPALPHPRQAARRPSGKGACCSACSSTRCSPTTSMAKWDVTPLGRRRAAPHPCARPGAPSSAKAHQSAVRRSGQRPSRGTGRGRPLQHLGKTRGRPHRHPLVTSWSTTPDDLAALKAALHEVM